jgi:hypothetical protein
MRYWLFDGFSFIDKHNGNIIFNFIQQLTMITDESSLGVIQVNVALAFRACQNFQQFFTDGHWVLLYHGKLLKNISKKAYTKKGTPAKTQFSGHSAFIRFKTA